MKRYLSIIILSLTINTYADDPRFDLMEAKIKELELRIKQLETDNEKSVDTVVLELSKKDKDQAKQKIDESFIKEVSQKLYKNELQKHYPWTIEKNWEGIEKGLSVEELILKLGEPTRKTKSLKPREDYVFFYKGSLEEASVPIEGIIRIFKNKIKSYTIPQFSPQ